MSAPAATARLPLLAYVYHPQSFAPLSIVEAAEGVCRLLWVVDGAHPDAAVMRRLLAKFGPVIDGAGATADEVAARIAEHAPAGILSLHDADLVWAAQLAERLGLPFHSVDTAVKLTDKHAQRLAFEAAELTVPAFTVIPAAMDAQAAARSAEHFPFPAVLKPRQGQSSRDTLPIASLHELATVIGDLGARADMPHEEYVLEQFVPDASTPLGGVGFAPFVSVESVVEDGVVAHAAISARTAFRWPFRETGYFTPSALEPELQAEVMRVATDAAAALGVTIGCLHTEIKLTDAGPVVIEVNGRPGGGMSEMLERASGFSILRTALRLAVGDPIGLRGPVACSRIGYLLYVFPTEDVEWIDAVEGLPGLRAHAGVDEIVLVRGPGRRIDWREGSEAHVFHLTGTTADLAELRRLIHATTTVVRISGHDEPVGALAERGT
ncbi:MAG: ATP-grasp domain-containing protein [Microbacteriaceae bacterium]|nr:ATP-grasp domain-containing protein [Microbacteriaceae bacterium]MCL2793689.1 ATP-grasp domain-containing protein [Microbacteriaceae bacterium]